MAVDNSSSCDEFLDGSIYRVKLHNFLTYSDAEFFPGPRLNLILGPNGTGKSSIVCALCVGLSGSTKLLGRAEKVGQFVRHEKDSGYTEIELYFEKGNKSIRRNIYRDNKSTWMINGRDATQREVNNLMKSAKIQIDNLCQFLPQDKVGEFSRMNPVQLLKATENAIMDGELAVQHDKIIELQSSMKDKERELENAKASLELKKNENLQREKEVERILEHETRIKETELMEKKTLWLEFEEMKQEVEDAKEEKKKCKQAIEKAKEEKITPLEELLEKEKLRMDDIRAKKHEASQSKKKLEDKLFQEKKRVDTLEGAQSSTISEIQQLRSQHEQTKRKLQRVEHDLKEWKKERDNMPETSVLKAKKNELEKEQRAKDMERAQITSERETKSRDLAQIHDDMRRLESRIARLDDVQAQRRMALERIDRDAIRAADWVKKNQHRLKRKVWGPVALEMQVRETLHGRYVEDTLQKWVMGALVTECYEDYDFILKELNSSSSDRISATVVNVQDGRCSPIKRPYNPDELESFKDRFGITGYLDELITAPEIIHEVLRSHGGVHTVLVGTNKTEDLINRGMDIFSALSSGDKKAAFVTPSKKYVSSVSKYGDRNVTTRTNDIKDAKVLGASNLNDEERHRLQSNLDELKATSAKLNVEISALKAKERDFAENRNQLMREIADIRNQAKEKLRIDERISEYENKMQNLCSELSRDLSDKENSLERKLRNQITKQTKQIGECLKITMELLRAGTTDAAVSLELSAQELRVSMTEKELSQAKTTIVDLQQAYSMAKETLIRNAKRAMALKRRAEEVAPWDEYESEFAQLPDDLDDLRARIENNKASLDCFRGDISIREEFQRVCAEIKEEERHLKQLEGFVSNGEDEINEIKQTWHNDLKEVVKKIDNSFKEFFQDIGCAGEIKLLDEDEDISKWGIERRAKFRKGTDLSTMTAEEQSGGEKSVGTIMYLMALQNQTLCPFRVVDEINQGMDVYNERKVFRRITKSSCGSKLPQYFLITPKLITGLEYHRDTKVMVILNGPWNKIRQEHWDTKKFIASCRRAKRQAHDGNETLSGPERKRIRAI